jgi:glutamate dehydrogenase
MTDAVAAAVLADNYLQSQAVSLLEREAAQRLDEHANLIRSLERDGLLKRAIEYLPDDEAIADRRSSGKGLTRPELSVLLSYSKMSLYEALLEGQLPDEPWLERELLGYFPPRLVERHTEALKLHRLRREIIATVLTNDIVNRMGMAFCQRTAEELGLARELVVRACVVAVEVFDANALWQAIEALDNQLPADLQYRAHARVNGLVKHAVLWALMQGGGVPTLADAVARYQSAARELEAELPDLLPPSYRQEWDAAMQGDSKAGIPEALARRLANTRVLGSLPDIVELSLAIGQPLLDVSRTYFRLGEEFSIPWMLGAIIALRADGRWQALARATLRDDAYRLHRKLTNSVLDQAGDSESALDHWFEANQSSVRFARQRIAEIQATGISDFQTLTVILRELRKLCVTS